MAVTDRHGRNKLDIAKIWPGCYSPISPDQGGGGLIKKILFAVGTLVSLAYASLVGGPLDGTSWDVKVRPSSFFSFSRRGTLNFEKGKLSAAGAISSGFSPSLYSARPADGSLETVWNASLSDAEKGIISWSGLVHGNRIEGIAVWWTRTGKPRHYTFRGTRRNTQ
jgi:hypothetical protein